jgi:hypothetical protein
MADYASTSTPNATNADIMFALQDLAKAVKRKYHK